MFPILFRVNHPLKISNSETLTLNAADRYTNTTNTVLQTWLFCKAVKIKTLFSVKDITAGRCEYMGILLPETTVKLQSTY